MKPLNYLYIQCIYYLFITYIVTSKPKRISVAAGLVHMMLVLYKCYTNRKVAVCVTYCAFFAIQNHQENHYLTIIILGGSMISIERLNSDLLMVSYTSGDAKICFLLG